jgi:hypothetical protein
METAAVSDAKPSALRLAIRASNARISEVSGPVAQLGERRPRMAEVRGSSPLGSTPENVGFAGQIGTARKGREESRPFLTVTRLSEGFSHRS